MSFNHIKKSSIPIKVREILSRTTLRYGFIHVRQTKIPKSGGILLVSLRTQSLPQTADRKATWRTYFLQGRFGDIKRNVLSLTDPSSREINAKDPPVRKDEKVSVWNSETAKHWRAQKQEAS